MPNELWRNCPLLSVSGNRPCADARAETGRNSAKRWLYQTVCQSEGGLQICRHASFSSSHVALGPPIRSGSNRGQVQRPLGVAGVALDLLFGTGRPPHASTLGSAAGCCPRRCGEPTWLRTGWCQSSAILRPGSNGATAGGCADHPASWWKFAAFSAAHRRKRTACHRRLV